MDQLIELVFQLPDWAFIAVAAVCVVWGVMRKLARRKLSGKAANTVAGESVAHLSAEDEAALVAWVAIEMDPIAKGRDTKGLGASGYGVMELPRHSVQGGDFIRSIGGHSETARLAARLGQDTAASVQSEPAATKGSIAVALGTVFVLIKRIFAIVRVASVAAFLAVVVYPFLSDEHKVMLEPVVNVIFPSETFGPFADLFDDFKRGELVSDANVMKAQTALLATTQDPEGTALQNHKMVTPQLAVSAAQTVRQVTDLGGETETQTQQPAAADAVVAAPDAPLLAGIASGENRVFQGWSDELKAELAVVMARKKANQELVKLAAVKDWHPGTGKVIATTKREVTVVRTMIIQGGAGNDVIIAGNFSMPEMPSGAKWLLSHFSGQKSDGKGLGALQVLAALLGLMALLWLGLMVVRRWGAGPSAMKDPFERLLERRLAEMA